VIICGRAEGPGTEGLRDLANIVRKDDVVTAWRKAVIGGTPALGEKPELTNLVETLFDACHVGRVDTLNLAEYLTAIGDLSARDLRPVFDEMWRVGLLRDEQALDRGQSARRLQTNLQV
jgi:hypothetical protein